MVASFVRSYSFVRNKIRSYIVENRHFFINIFCVESSSQLISRIAYSGLYSFFYNAKFRVHNLVLTRSSIQGDNSAKYIANF